MLTVLANILLFSALGVAVEVAFSSIGDAIHQYKKTKTFDKRLIGKTYLWMFPIYGLIGFLFPYAQNLTFAYTLPVRLLVYGIAILIVEFILGFILEKLTGRCPWHYEKGWHIMGYIRIDYLPFWMLFAWGVELIFNFFN